MSEAKKLMDMARQTENQANREYNETIEKAEEAHKKAMFKVNTLVEAAQAVCGHEYVRTERWTEDGAFPNEPRSRVDCSICNKQGVM